MHYQMTTEDQQISLMFSLRKLTFYQTLHVSRVWLCTRSNAADKVVDDSNIIFLLDGIDYPGRIQTIFTVEDDEFHLVAYITDITCEVDKNENFVYPNIQSTTSSQYDYVTIEIKDSIEKSVFFRSQKGISQFLRHPTLDPLSWMHEK